MSSNFEKMHKILSGLNTNIMSTLLNSKGENIKDTPLFIGENGTFNKELLTKEGFIKSIFSDVNEKTREIYECLYDAIANLDGNKEMSEEELKFIASFGGDKNKNIIDKDDFTALGLIGRDINKYIPENGCNIGIADDEEADYEEIDSAEEDAEYEDDEQATEAKRTIVSENKGMKLEPVTAVNDELGINGKIDTPVIQGSVGDCWLLGGINALNSTEKGREIIRNSIVPNEDGTVTIKFAGANKEITLTADEIKKHDTDTDFQDNYSNGDNDALVIEMAMQKLITENSELFPRYEKGINGGSAVNFFKALIPGCNITEITDIFTNEDDSYNPEMYTKELNDLLKKAAGSKNIAIAFSSGGHVMAVSAVSENTVTYTDSMNDTQYTVSWDEFRKLAGNITYADLSSLSL